MSDLHDRANVMFNQTIVAALQRPDINNHVHFAGAVHDRPPRFVGLYISQRRAQRESNHRTDRHAAALQVAGTGAHPGGIYANRSKVIVGRLFAQMFDFSLRRVGF